MVGYMSISVRVMTAHALAQMKMLEKELAGVNSQMVKSGAASAVFSSGMTKSTSSLTKFGNQLQWTGRQLSYNFSLPLAAAGAAAMKFALDNEAGMTRVAKVYGDSSIEATALKKELTLLEKAFVSLSSHYGVQQKEVLDIAAAWASAGASGIVLAKGVETTLKTMVLGEMSAVEATQALISVQAQYNLSADELTDTMAMLNKVENETAVTTKDLIAGLSRSAGVARTAGIDVRHLAAMMASLVPAAGSAAEAGNGLKAIMTRMLAPTGEAAGYLNALGLKVDTLGWKSKNGTERLEAFSQAFHGLADSQKMAIAKALGSQYQINKLGVLLEDINKSFDKNTRGQSRYATALDATSDKAANLKQAEKELNTVLDSSPQKLKIIWTSLQNGMANAIQPLIPYLLYAANAVRSLFEMFTNLPPAVKKFVTIMLVALALFGPLIRYIGSTITLLSELRWFLLGTASGLMKLAMFPFTKVAAGVKSLLVIMRGGPAVAALWASSMTILKGIMAAAFVAMKVMTISFFGGMRVLFVAGQASLLATTAAFRAAMLVRWAGMLAAVKAITFSFGPIMTVIWIGMMNMLRVATAAGARAINVAMVALLNGMMAIAAAGARAITFIWESMIIAWQVVMSSGRAVMMAAMSAMTAVVAIGSTAMLGVWRTAVLAMTLVVATGRPMLIGALTATMGAARNVVAVGGAAIAAAWRWLMAAIAVAITAGQAAIYRAWIAVQAGIRALWATMPAFFAVVNGAIRTVMAAGGALAASAFRLGLAAGMLKLKAIIPAIVGMFRTMGIAIQAALTGPIGWAIGAAVLLLVMFGKQIRQVIDNAVAYFQNLPAGVVEAFRPLGRIWQNIVEFAAKCFNMLPESVQNAMMSVVRVVESAAMQVYKLFSYLNPFARHSPSLVESVTAGMAEINKQFETLSNISGPIKKAHDDIEAFAQATLKLRQGMDSMERAQDRANLAKLAPGALDEFDALVADITTLSARLNAMTPIVKAQESVVAGWKTKLDAANAALDIQKTKLDALKDVASKATEALNASKDELERFASAPIQGMKDMNDAIFENDMAQKKLRLEMLKMGDGEGIDKAKDKLSKLAGEIELLNGEQTRLRSGGAGSEITGVYDEQIKELEKQQKSTQDTLSGYDKLADALEKLQRQSEMLDLEKSLKFDPLLKKISETAHAVKELPLDEIMTGINRSNLEIEKYGKEVDKANEAVRRQQQVVDEATKARDAISARYDAENAKLTTMKDAYDQVKNAIDDANRALSDLNQTASKTLTSGKKKGDLLGTGANFADVGGKGALGREGDAAFNEKALEQFAQDQAKKTSDLLGEFDMFGGIKKKWNEFKAWLDKNAGPMWSGVVTSAQAIFGGVDFSGFTGKVSGFWDKVTGIWNKAVEIVGKIWALFRDDIKAIWDTIWAAIAPAWKKIQPSLAQFGELLGPIGELMGKIWSRVKPLVAIIAGGLLLALKIAASVIKNVVGPVLGFLIDTLKFLLDTVFNTVKFIVAIFNGDWKAAWDAFLSIQKAALDWMLSLFVNLGKTLWGIVKGVVEGVFGFFEWLYDELIGHSIIPDMINGIIDWFKSLPGKVWTALQSLGTKIVEAVKAAWSAWVAINTTMWTGIYNWFLGLALKVYNAVIAIRQKLVDVATAAWAAFKARSQEAWTAIIIWVSGLWKQFTGGLSVLKSKLVEVGKNVMQGLVDGLEVGWQWVKDKVEAVAELIPDSIKKVLGIASPAKVTDTLGQQTMQGYGNGIVKKIPELQKAAADAATAVTNAMPSTINSSVGISAEADTTGFASAFVVPAQTFFEVKMPELWKLLTKQSLEAWMQIEKNFTDKYVFFVKDFYEKVLPESWKILTAQAAAMWLAILASFNSKIKTPLTTFFTTTIKSQWASMTSSAALMWTTIYGSFKTQLGDPVVLFFKETIPGAIRSAFAGIGTVFKGAFSTAAATAAAAVNKVIGAVNRGIDAMNAVIPEVKFDIKKVATIALKAGGAVNGPGTGTSDSINAKLSRGEHVWTAREVAAAGGHGAVESMRKAVVQGFAKGGAVGDINASHAVGGKAGLIAFGHFLTKRGFDVTEGPAPFGPISYGGHSSNSLHYSGNAIDVNKGAGTSTKEQGYIDGIVKYAKEYGLRTLWRVKDHFNHAHFDTGRGDQVGSGGGGGIVDYITQGKAAIDSTVKAEGAKIGAVADYVGAIGAGAFKNMGESIKAQAASIWQNFSATGDDDSGPGRIYGKAEIARIAEATARGMGATDKQLLALFETGLVESGFKNYANSSVPSSMKLPHDAVGRDHDSVGYLQQRVGHDGRGAGWGTVEQAMNPAFATRSFIKRAQKKDSSGLTAGQLAQRVQVSAFPEKYAQRRKDALAMLNRDMPGIPTNIYDRGGWLNSGSAAMNLSGKRELVLTPQQSATLTSLGGPNSLPSLSRLTGLVARSEARANQLTASPTTVIYEGSTNHTELHFHGNLEFPNVKDGGDAEGFVRQLGILAGGQE